MLGIFAPPQVRVVDPCAPAQMTCLGSLKCSVLNKICDPQLVEQFSTAGSAPEPTPFVLEPDTTPPVLQFSGACEAPLCKAAVTPSGLLVQVHRLVVGQEFLDPGRAALFSFGNLVASWCLIPLRLLYVLTRATEFSFTCVVADIQVPSRLTTPTGT
jgi:hypothetical protein